MNSDHPDLESFQQIFEGAASDQGAKTFSVPVVRHLLAGCKSCQSQTRQAWFRGVPQDAAAAYQHAFQKPVDEACHTEAQSNLERDQATLLLRDLLAEPRHRQEILVQNSHRFHTWQLAELLLQESQEIRLDSPLPALHLANLSVLVAGRLKTRYPQALVEDLLGRAYSEKGNIQRVLGDPQGAAASLSEADAHLTAGTNDPLDRARLLSFEASLHSDRGEYATAVQKLRVAARTYRSMDDVHQVGRTLIQSGINIGFLEDYEGAIRLLALGLQRIDTEREPRLVLIARHNLIHYLNEAGRTRQALTLLHKTRPMYEEMGDHLSLARMNWLEGNIALALGNLDEAESALIKAQEGLLAQGVQLEAMMVCLDLAQILVLEKRTTELRRLTQEMIPIFESRDLRVRAFEAFILFHKAVEAEALTLGLIKDLARTLRRERGREPMRR